MLLDADVLFAAAYNAFGKATFLFEMAARSRPPWRLLSSVYGVEEARRNLATKSPQGLADFARQCAVLEIAAQPAAVIVPLALPVKGQPIWSAALAAGATRLLSGDVEDFGPHMNNPTATAGLLIQKVGDYLHTPTPNNRC